jgi:oligopeptidase B
VTNKDKATNFKLMKTPENATSKENWKDLIPHREDVLLEDIEIFKNFLVVEERSNGLNKIRIMPWNGKGEYYLPFESETYTAYTTTNVDFDTDILRYSYQSMTTPSSVIDFNMKSKTKEIKKEQQVLGGKFDKNNYIEERIWATAKDGTKIPISMVYRQGLNKDGKNPLLLYAYGSYGHSMDATFSSTRLTLLDRGFIFAIAHIRGGEDLGRQWYEDGKLLKKKNTFTDFIDCSKFVIEQKYTSSEHLYAEGGSAGGGVHAATGRNWSRSAGAARARHGRSCGAHQRSFASGGGVEPNHHDIRVGATRVLQRPRHRQQPGVPVGWRARLQAGGQAHVRSDRPAVAEHSAGLVANH